MNLEINSAKAEDAESIQRLHHASVRTNAESFYSPEIIDAWAKPDTKEELDSIRKAIKDNKEILIVALVDGKVVGFGAVVPSENELRAVYIDPQFGRLGIGTKILKALEKIATDHNSDKLTLSGSLNSESFYKKNGYKVLNYSSHTLSTGVKMKCVNMEKIFDDVKTSSNSI